jgi:hypothetical protein
MAKRAVAAWRADQSMTQTRSDETATPAFSVDVVATPEHRDLDGAGIPDLFIKPLRNRWSRGRDWIVLATILEARNPGEWAQLGTALVRELLSLGTSSGVAMDGQGLSDAVAHWLSSTTIQSGSSQVTNVQVTAEPHPMMRSGFATNVTWTSLHTASPSEWLLSLWDHLDSNTFNYGADLLLTIYQINVVPRLPWPKPLTLDVFSKTLGDAIAWLVPLDDNIGFILGLAGESPLRTRLLQKVRSGTGESEVASTL